MFLILLSTWSNGPPVRVGGVIMRLFPFEHSFMGKSYQWGGGGGGLCDYSVTPSHKGLWIFYFFGYGIGIGTRETGFGTRA